MTSGTTRLTVHVPFPSGRPKSDRLEKAFTFLQRWPLALVCPFQDTPGRWSADPDYLSGSESERLDDLLASWTDPDMTIAWCGRGGYGSTRLLGFLEQALAGRTVTPTRFLGYSDITALFAFIRTLGLPIECVHTPVLTEIFEHPQPEIVLEALHGRATALPVTNPDPRCADFENSVWGGNLAVLASLAGTPWLPKIRESAILLEDIDETPYRLDRFVTQLHDSGFFRHSPGVFLGYFTRCGQGSAGGDLVKTRLRELDIPLLGELPVGHEPDHRPLFLDRIYRFDPSSGCLVPHQQGSTLSARTA